jgi:heme/copper-type cytochrome/quinol oxidase subunit 3
MVPYPGIYRYTPVDTAPGLTGSLNTGDTVREAARGCYPVSPGIYTYYLLVSLVSESILFTTLFLVLYGMVLAQGLIPGESLVVPEPLELAYGTALLLSLAGAMVGTVHAGRASLGIPCWSPYYPLLTGSGFLLVQSGEFLVLGVHTQDTSTGTTCITVSGLHPIHVLYGTLVVGASSGTGYSMDITGVDTIPLDTYPILAYTYWHLVELVYTCIYVPLYYYWIRVYRL